MAKNTLDRLFKQMNQKKEVATAKKLGPSKAESFQLSGYDDSVAFFLKEVGAYAANLRRVKHMNQGELGKKVGIQQPYISLFENGRLNCRVQTLVRILSELDTDLEIRIVPKNKKIEVMDTWMKK